MVDNKVVLGLNEN